MTRQPKRIQWHRGMGKMPEGARYVGRPSRFGNPFAVGEAGVPDRAAAVDRFSRWLRGENWGVPQGQTRASMAAKRVVIRRNLSELRGIDLACACPLDDQPCHADVLLQIANEVPE